MRMKNVLFFKGKNNEKALYLRNHYDPDRADQNLPLNEEQVTCFRELYGRNVVSRGSGHTLPGRLMDAFVNPFTGILTVLAIVSVFTDIVWAAPGERNAATVVIITTMVVISGLLRLIQETRSGHAAEQLQKMIRTTACVERAENGKEEIPLEEIVSGDIVHLSAGDIVPADLKILSAKDLFVSQAALTGESEPVEKIAWQFRETAGLSGPDEIALTHMQRMPDTDDPSRAFLGSTVVSGTAKAVVIAVGDATLLGGMAKTLNEKPPKTGFEKGINAVSKVLIRFMLAMVPVIFFVNGFTKGNWGQALLFAISIAVGLTPEMLPMIVTANLARGALAMSKKKVIIKNLNAIQNLGSMDILCTDKTGTLTQDKVVLAYYLDIHGNEDTRILRHAYLNSFFQTGLKNLIDLAIIDRQDRLGSEEIRRVYTKVDEIPFDFTRRRMSVVVADTSGKTQLVTKGAVEEMLHCCGFAEYEGSVTPLTEDVKSFILEKSYELNSRGFRVLAVAHKTNPAPEGEFSVADESEMVLLGFLALLDPPKSSAASALRLLKEQGVIVKVLTGDNEKVTLSIAGQVKLDVNEMLLGLEIEGMGDEELKERIEKVTVFAKLSPEQKARVVRLMREKGHIVGFMGDGINDAAAMKVSDVGISVDTAVDIAKESADVILLEKNLNVLEEGIIEGRKTYANMIKYIKMTASSNFGNVFSVLAASAFLPFLPMQALHLILLNLIYDLSCTAMPWDNVDSEFIEKPGKWDADSVGRFMLRLGPVSSIFDIATFALLYFIICPAACGGSFQGIADTEAVKHFIALFRTGWFVESMWSQILVIHMLRTPKLPLIQSRASMPVSLLTFSGAIIVTVIPFTSMGYALGFSPLPAVFFAWLLVILLYYMILVTFVKKAYVKRYGSLL